MSAERYALNADVQRSIRRRRKLCERQYLIDSDGSDHRSEEVLFVSVSQCREINRAVFALNRVLEAGRPRRAHSAQRLDSHPSRSSGGQPVNARVACSGTEAEAIKLDRIRRIEPAILLAVYDYRHLSAPDKHLQRSWIDRRPHTPPHAFTLPY